MEQLQLKAAVREETGNIVKKERKKDKLPVVLYGQGVKNENLYVDYKDFEIVFKKAGGSSLVDLIVNDKKPVKVIIQEVQRDPVTDVFIHADFHQVSMTQKISADVVLTYVGEAPAVKEAGGILIKSLDKIKVECLPHDLVHEIEVDISSLATHDDIIRVKDLIIPSGLTLRDQPDDVVVNIQPPRTEAEIEALKEEVEEKVEEVEGIKEEKEADEGEEAESSKAEEDAKSVDTKSSEKDKKDKKEAKK